LWLSLIWRLDLLIYRRNSILWSLLMMRSTIKDLRTWLESYILWELTLFWVAKQVLISYSYTRNLYRERMGYWSDIGVRWGSSVRGSLDVDGRGSSHNNLQYICSWSILIPLWPLIKKPYTYFFPN
jgi:hypothetical protein